MQSESPLISVIVPVYNGAQFLGEALDSVVRQDYRPVEIIVIDDASTDASAEVATARPAVRYLRQDRAGVAAARNRGLAHATGDFIAFLDQDDMWTNDKLRVQLAFLQAHPEIDCVYARQHLVYSDGARPPPWVRPDLVDKDHDALLPSALLARRALFDKTGEFDTSYVNGSDADWLFRVRDVGCRDAVVPQTLVLRRVHASNASHDIDLGVADLFRAMRASVRRKKT